MNLDYALVLADRGRDLACVFPITPQLSDGELFSRIYRLAIKPMQSACSDVHVPALSCLPASMMLAGLLASTSFETLALPAQAPPFD
jgi:hypothetical protein